MQPQRRALLKRLHICIQRFLAELVAAGRQKSCREGEHPRSYAAVRGADMRKLSDKFEPFLKASQVGMQKTEIVVQPAIVIADSLLRQWAPKISQQGTESLP